MKISKLTATASGVFVVLLAVGGWLLFKPPAHGPLSSLIEGGQPLITDSGGPVQPREPHIATAYVVNSSDDPATLVSASLVPVTGLPAARLAHVAVDTNHDYNVAGRDWPPGVPIEPLPGARLGHGQTGEVFAVTGPRRGTFAGLLVPCGPAGHLAVDLIKGTIRRRGERAEGRVDVGGPGFDRAVL